MAFQKKTACMHKTVILWKATELIQFSSSLADHLMPANKKEAKNFPPVTQAMMPLLTAQAFRGTDEKKSLLQK